jgi:chemotaxis protein MotB
MQSQAGYPRPKRPKKDNLERWLLTYSDLITLLLAFFVIMYGISSADAQKFTKLSAAMRRAFNVGVLQGDPSASILDQTTGISTEAGSAEDMSASAMELDTIFNEMGSVLQDEYFADRVSVGVRDDGVAISVSGNLLFASGRADLRPDAIKLLQAVGRVLNQLPNPVRVEGYTDDVPPSGTEFPTNWELSGARAVAVVRYLTEIEGIDPSRLSAVAYSQYRPVAPNDSARDRAKNRRSEIVILNMPATPSPTAAAGATATPWKESGVAGATR